MPGPSSERIDRIQGALLALACGDALGAPAEFKSQDYVRQRWGTLQDMVGGGNGLQACTSE